MRILHVVSTLNISSGIANFIVNYYRYLAKEDVTFDFLLFYDAPNSFDEEVKKMGSNIYYIPRPTVRTVNKYAREVEKLFEEEGSKWDVVHIHEILVSKYVKKSAQSHKICATDSKNDCPKEVFKPCIQLLKLIKSGIFFTRPSNSAWNARINAI